MKQEIKDSLYGAEQLQELLGMSRTQAWRVWNGHSKLTKRNEELIQFKLGALDEAIEKRDENAMAWLNNRYLELSSKTELELIKKFWTKESGSITCKIVNLESKGELMKVDEISSLLESACYEPAIDCLTSAYFEMMDCYTVEEKKFLTEDYK